MATDIDICNLALGNLGCKTISSLATPVTTVEAKYCRIYYAQCRDQVLIDHDWNFAEKEKYISLLVGEDSERFDYAYEYPSDCLNIRRIHQFVEGEQPIKYVVNALSGENGRKILTNQATPLLVYTIKITNTSLFNAAFVEALSWRLAASLAMPLTKSRTKARDAMVTYIGMINTAKTIDSIEGDEKIEVTTDFLAARE